MRAGRACHGRARPRATVAHASCDEGIGLHEPALELLFAAMQLDACKSAGRARAAVTSCERAAPSESVPT
jgi:hypothetical protein